MPYSLCGQLEQCDLYISRRQAALQSNYLSPVGRQPNVRRDSKKRHRADGSCGKVAGKSRRRYNLTTSRLPGEQPGDWRQTSRPESGAISHSRARFAEESARGVDLCPRPERRRLQGALPAKRDRSVYKKIPRRAAGCLEFPEDQALALSFSSFFPASRASSSALSASDILPST